MATPALTRTRSVLHINPSSTFVGGWLGDDSVSFARVADESDELRRSISFDRDAWLDMGRPVVITVTIEPGDLLNAGGDDA